eukprot:s4203_g4.t1
MQRSPDAYCLVFDIENILFLQDPRAPSEYKRQIAACVGLPSDRVTLFPAAPRVMDVEVEGLACRTALAIADRRDLCTASCLSVLVDMRDLGAGWRTWLAYRGHIFCPELLRELQRFAPVGWVAVVDGVTPHHRHLAVRSGQVLVARTVRDSSALWVDTAGSAPPLEPAEPAVVHAPRGEATTGYSPEPLSSGVPGPAAPGGTIEGTTDAGALDADTQRDRGVTQDPSQVPSEYFLATFLVFVQAFTPEVVTVRIPVGAHRHEALTLVSAGRLPLQRLRFPRLFPARPQTFAGFAVLMAAPMWHSTGACVVFDTRLVNGRIFSLCVSSRLTAVDMLRLARLPDISQVLFFVGEIPWPLGRDSAADLCDGDVIHVVPSAHAPMAVAFFDDLLLDPAYWLPEPPVLYVAVAAVWLLCGLSGSLHFVQPGGNRTLRSDVADALGVPAPLLALHRAADVGEDFVQDGVPVQEVFAVVAPPETTAPARSFVFCFLDLRPALRGFSQLRASGRWLAREAIVARVSGFCPPGYQPALSVAGRPPSILTPGFAVEEALVIVVDFVPRNLAASDWVHVFAPPEYEDGSSPPRPSGTGEGHASPAHATRSAGSSLDLSGEAASGSGPSTVDALSTASRDVRSIRDLTVYGLARTPHLLHFASPPLPSLDSGYLGLHWGLCVPPVVPGRELPPLLPRPVPTPCRSSCRGHASPLDGLDLLAESLRTLLDEASAADDRWAFQSVTLLEVLVEHFAEGGPAHFDAPPANGVAASPIVLCLQDCLPGVLALQPVRPQVETFNLDVGSCVLPCSTSEAASLLCWCSFASLCPPPAGIDKAGRFASWVDTGCVGRSLAPDETLVLTTDGSFDPRDGSAAWALVFSAVGSDGRLPGQFLGCAGGPFPEQFGPASAYLAEVLGLLWASIFALGLPFYGEVLFRADNVAALRGAEGVADMRPHVLCAAANSFHLALRAGQRSRCFYQHVPGHAGDFPNELADGLAGLCCSGVGVGVPSHICLDHWLRDGAKAALWLPHILRSSAGHTDLPEMRHSAITWGLEEPESRLDPAALIAPFARQFVAQTASGDCRRRILNASLVSYNALSLLGDGTGDEGRAPGLYGATGRVALLSASLKEAGTFLAGIQEARTPAGSCQGADFRRLCSGATARNSLGVELWIACGPPWPECRAQVLFADHSRLLARLSFLGGHGGNASLPFAFFMAVDPNGFSFLMLIADLDLLCPKAWGTGRPMTKTTGVRSFTLFCCDCRFGSQVLSQAVCPVPGVPSSKGCLVSSNGATSSGSLSPGTLLLLVSMRALLPGTLCRITLLPLCAAAWRSVLDSLRVAPLALMLRRCLIRPMARPSRTFSDRPLRYHGV